MDLLAVDEQDVLKCFVDQNEVNFLINENDTVVKFVVEYFFVFGSVPEDEAVVGGGEEHDLVGVDAEASDGFFVFPELFFEIPGLPVPEPDQSILMSHGNNMFIDSFKTVDDAFGLFGLFGSL